MKRFVEGQERRRQDHRPGRLRHFNGDQVLTCEATGVLPCIPKNDTSGNVRRCRFTQEDFVCDAAKDHYTCPAGQILD